MADAHGGKGGGGGDSGGRFLLLFFGGLFLFWLFTGAGEGPGLFNMNSSSGTTTSWFGPDATKEEVLYEAPADR